MSNSATCYYFSNAEEKKEGNKRLQDLVIDFLC